MSSDKICPECNQEYTITVHRWCKPCCSKHFQNDFNNWTSGDDKIDKFIQDTQLNANDHLEVIEWIPYDRFKDVKQIGKGGFGTIHYARWIDGRIRKWNIENQQWKRDRNYGEVEVALKKFDNFVNFNDVLNEMAIHLKINRRYASVKFYGITQDPETYSYMMVLEYAKDGNLREYLKINFNNISWFQKLFNLTVLSSRLMNIHEEDIVHHDFHPGNILSDGFNYSDNLQISDFGLSKLIGTNPICPEKKNVVGVLPYIAPEVLSGDEEYTKAADVYSFGIISYEIVTGFPPYPDIPHNKDLAMKICNGLRPKIPFRTPKLITIMIMRCWDARVTHRPTFKELKNELWKYHDDYNDYLDEGKNEDEEIVIQIEEAEEFSANQESTNRTATTTTTPFNYQTHPQAIYTSRLLNFKNLPKPKNEENFERELEELTKSMSNLCPKEALVELLKNDSVLYLNETHFTIDDIDKRIICLFANNSDQVQKGKLETLKYLEKLNLEFQRLREIMGAIIQRAIEESLQKNGVLYEQKVKRKEQKAKDARKRLEDYDFIFLFYTMEWEFC
ncbi:hypothetical protein Glove_259g6 [Diversispora epigaea]|uniref:Protein kinase domain-containing protein n=1 Tax=Diversispora epigaea TaxID=1348612 RepID=A0A397IDD0_9GLOM|nr:hypothetical protein Glove_259g6 [Diversispora epigaea]